MEAALNIELNDWCERGELKWKQKSCELWLREGDHNLKFFHLSTLVRRRRNQITEILLPDGNWILSRRKIGEYFAKYFLKVFQSSNPLISDNLEDLILPSISEVENEDLTRIPEINEIKEVVWEMHPLKALGPDGFSSLFYKKYWTTVSPQVVSAIQSFFKDGEFLKN